MILDNSYYLVATHKKTTTPTTTKKQCIATVCQNPEKAGLAPQPVWPKAPIPRAEQPTATTSIGPTSENWAGFFLEGTLFLMTSGSQFLSAFVQNDCSSQGGQSHPMYIHRPSKNSLVLCYHENEPAFREVANIQMLGLL